jgi:hypothetical protein
LTGAGTPAEKKAQAFTCTCGGFLTERDMSEGSNSRLKEYMPHLPIQKMKALRGDHLPVYATLTLPV